ncbi:DUF2929 family protein [Sporosarcina aquimarina]|uniref:DUF2929 family protein n=1 Tax=Sporosarcina aquimarina TaxID=114975 RepID=A0ABU4G3D6_9BACL|nr:DUF2929 family protein [Sporosarcina aquimarina]MDW0111431.1 DUF2929 family protein [Sporosarcina aquimarina]
MKFIMTFVWSFLLVSMLNYVAGAIANVPTFEFTTGIIVSVVLSLMIFAISAVIGDEPVAEH